MAELRCCSDNMHLRCSGLLSSDHIVRRAWCHAARAFCKSIFSKGPHLTCDKAAACAYGSGIQLQMDCQ